MDGHLFLHDAAGLTGVGVGTHVALDHIGLFHNDAVMLRKKLQHLANLAVVFTGNDHDLVALANTKVFHIKSPKGLQGRGR